MSTQKQKLTDDQAEMLEYLSKKGTFETDDLFDFFSAFDIWNTHHKLEIYKELSNLDLIQAQSESLTRIDDKTIEYTAKGLCVTEEAKTLLRNYQSEQAEIKRRRQLELEHIESIIATNKSVKTTNSFQKVILLFTALFTLITLFISWLAYKKDSTVNANPKVIILPVLESSKNLPLTKDKSDSLKAIIDSFSHQ